MMTALNRCACLLIALVGCAKPVALPPPVSLDSARSGVSELARIPPLDDRAYRIVKLDNGLTALLVSDPEAMESAAALAVGVGSFAEPDDRPGLAHFLEHMLSKGTDLYPEVSGFKDYLALHAGQSNALTEDEFTSYYFTVNPGGFDHALHRFSRFFIHPLLKERAVNKERSAVESEYRLKIKDRGLRWSEVKRETVNPDHPGSRFSWGSLQTLADRPDDRVIDDLRAFYDAHYTANRMQLALVHTAPLDTLEGWVRSWFAEVPAGPGADLMAAPPQFRDDQLGVRINIQQLEDVHSVVLEWPIFERREFWPEDPTALVSHVLRDEGPGSLFAQLAARDWVTALDASTDPGIGPDGDLFQIEMLLTAEGVQHTDEIVAACFAAIETLRQTPMPSYLAQEMQSLDEIDFRFEPPEDAGPLTEWTVETMLKFPAERVLDFWLTPPIEDPALIADLLDQLSIDRVRVIIEGKDVETDQVEPMFNVGYRIRPLDESERAAYTAGSDIAVTMPPPNPWIPSSTEVRTTEVLEQARRLEGQGVVSVAPDARWKTPRAITQLDLNMSLDGYESVDDQMLAVLYGSLLYQHLTDFRYPIEVSSSEYQVSIRSVRFRLRVNSWLDVHTDLIDTILAKVRAFELSSERFEIKKATFLRSYKNYVHAGPIRRISYAPVGAIFSDSPSVPEWIEALEAIEFEDLESFVQNYWRPGRARVVSYGDTSDAIALTARDHLLRHAAVDEAQEVHDFEDIRWYPQGTSRTHEVQVDHDDSAVWMMYVGETGRVSLARWALLANLLKGPFFNQLRSKQQLGYSVDLWNSSPMRVPTIRLALQSSVKGPTVLLDRVDAFLQNSPALLMDMSPTDFTAARDSLAQSYREPASTFDEHWSIIRRAFAWSDTAGDHYDRVADAMDSITQEEVVNLARELFTAESPTRIVAWAVGRVHAGDPLGGTADCADRACLAEGMQTVFTQDFSNPE